MYSDGFICGIFQTIAAVASYFLIVADFSRSTVTAGMAASALRENAALKANLTSLMATTTVAAMTAMGLNGTEMGITETG